MSNEIEKLRIAESQTETNPTPEQKESGNYPKGEVNLLGFDIVIENPKGSFRSGVDENGQPWQCEIEHTYGYFKGTSGNDGDEVDVFIGDDLDKPFKVYIISQTKNGSDDFDEHKVMFGFESAEDAIDGYFDNYCEGWDGFGSMAELTIEEFKTWLAFRKQISSNATNQAFKMVSVEDFGDKRTKVIQLEGDVIEDETLTSLQDQAGNSDDFDTLVVEIASNGGSVLEGIKIMMWFDSVSALGKKVVTVVTANAYSIASLIMLASNERIISQTADVMVHNPMLPEISYANAEALEEHAKELRALEGIMYELYQIFTGLTQEQIKELMDNETYLNADEAKKYGFVHRIENIKERPKAKSAVNKLKITDMRKLTNMLNATMQKLTGSNVVNQLYYDDKGGSFEIYQESTDTYKVGDVTSEKSTQKVLSDGSVLTIDGKGVITEIDRSKIVTEDGATAEGAGAGEGDGTKQEGEGAKAEGDGGFNTGKAPDEDLLNPDARAKAKAKMEAEKEAEVAKAKAQADEEEKILAQAKEIEARRGGGAKAEQGTEDPNKKDGDGNGGAVANGDNASTVEQEQNKNAVAEGDPAEAPKTVPYEDFMALMEVVQGMKEDLNALKNASAESAEFNEATARAIDVLAENTSSAFKPDAKAKSIATPHKTGSIFGQFVNR